MKVVMDTEVLLAGLLWPHHPASDVLQAIVNGAANVCYDGRILGEYRAALANPEFAFEPAASQDLLLFIESAGQFTVPSLSAKRSSATRQAMFIEVAEAAMVKAVVTLAPDVYSGYDTEAIQIDSPERVVGAVSGNVGEWSRRE